MALPKEKLLYTVDEYLARERASEERHEYLDGYIFAMVGESLEHADICVNLVREISTQLKGKPCRTLTKDSKVRSGPDPKPFYSKKGLYSYPDLVVVCGEPIWHDRHKDIILNPRVIIEVLSPTTSEFDHVEKFQRFQTWNISLTDYILVSQEEVLIEHYKRHDNDEWLYTRINTLSASLHIASIGCTILASEIYDRINFPPGDADSE
jgi:Uma2 family endonuclease